LHPTLKDRQKRPEGDKMGMQSCKVLALCGMVTLALAQLFPLTGHALSPRALFLRAQEYVAAVAAT
jgi:hypothetical protein